MSVTGGLGATPVGHSVEQMDDPLAKLQDADTQCTQSGKDVRRDNPTPLTSQLTEGESFFKPSHKLSLSGCDT